MSKSGTSFPFFFYYLFQFDSKQLNLWAPWCYPNISKNPTGWNALATSPWEAMLLMDILDITSTVSCASLWASSRSGRSYETATTPGCLHLLSCFLVGVGQLLLPNYEHQLIRDAMVFPESRASGEAFFFPKATGSDRCSAHLCTLQPQVPSPGCVILKAL